MRSARWAISFADLCLLLLGFLLILQARPDAHQLAKSLRSNFAPARPTVASDAKALFEPGEAILTTYGQRFVGDFLERAKKDAPILLASSGTDTGSARFDGWELAAARTAAIARALEGHGVSEKRIALQMDRTDGGGQRLSLETR